MNGFKTAVGAGALIALANLAGAPPLAALTMQECSAQFKEAQKSGTLDGMTWLEFRKKRCGPTSPRATDTPPTPTAAGRAVFPRAVSPRYSGESPGKARMQTCLDQYRANKASNANGGLKWVEKGGGYYSECNKRLKG